MNGAIQCTGYNARSTAVSCAFPPESTPAERSSRPFGEGVEIEFVSHLPPRARTAANAEQTYGRAAFVPPASPPAPPPVPPVAPPVAPNAPSQRARADRGHTATLEIEVPGLRPAPAPNPQAPNAPQGASPEPARREKRGGELGTTVYAFGRTPFLGFGPRGSLSTNSDGSQPVMSVGLALHTSLNPKVLGAGVTFSTPNSKYQVGECKSPWRFNVMGQISAAIVNVSLSPDCLRVSHSYEPADLFKGMPTGWAGLMVDVNPRDVPAWVAALPGVSDMLQSLTKRH